nr:hypothetical protein [Tanacetum cinerariifolium]
MPSTHEDVSIYDDVSIQDEGIEIVVEEEVVEAITTAKMIFEVAIVSTSVSAAATTITTAPTTDATKISVVINTSPRVKDKGKGKAKMIEEPEMPKKRKHQIRADEELAAKLQAEMQAKFDKEQRLMDEGKEKKEGEGKEKRAGDELMKESVKKQKVDDANETADLNKLMEVILKKRK